MPKLIDLTGKVFNNWRVIKKLPSKNKKTYWLCECEYCKTQKEIQGTHLKNNTCAKCSCTQKEKSIQTITSNKIKKCLICEKDFIPLSSGQSRKFCFECSPRYEKNNTQSRTQNITHIRRSIKQQLVNYKGGKCEICGYNKNLAALQFHHLDPSQKDFSISTNLMLKDFSMNNYYQEVDKCILLCANCHMEIHNPELSI